jgi:hypothetical protein
MKFQNVLLMCLCLGLGFVSCTESSISNENDNPLKTNFMSENCLQSLNEGGEVMSEEDARDAITGYGDKYGNDTIAAQYIRLETLRKILAEADQYNEEREEDSILGYRFYNGLTSRTVGTQELINRRDLVAVPTLENGDDLYHVYDTIQGFTLPQIYSKFRPCPRICGERKTIAIKGK